MQTSRKNQFFRNVGSGWLCTLIVGLAGFIMLPLNLKYLGRDVYGISVLAASILQLLSLINFGMSTTFLRFFSKLIADEDQKQFAILASTSFFFVGILGFLGGLLFLVCFPLFIEQYEIASVLHMEVFVLFLALAFSFWGRLLLLPLTAMIQGNHRYDFVNLIHILSVLLRLLLLYIGYCFVSKSLHIMSIAISGEILFNFLILYWMAYKIFGKSVLFRWNIVQLKIIPSLCSFGLLIFVTVFAFSLSIQIPVLIIGKYLGKDMVAAFAPALTLGTFLSSILGYIGAPLVPLASQDQAQNSGNRLGNISTLVSEVVACIGGCIIVGLYLVGDDFVVLWLGNEFVWTVPVIIATAAGIVFASIQNVNFNLALGASSVQPFAYSAVVMALLTISGTYLGTVYWHWNLFAVALYITLVRVLRNTFYLTFASSKVFHYNFLKYFIRVYIKPTFLVILVAVIGYGIKTVLPSHSPSLFLLIPASIIIAFFYGILGWFFVLSPEIKNQLGFLKKAPPFIRKILLLK